MHKVEEWFRWILSGMWALLLLLIGFVSRNISTRLKAIEDGKADREETDRRFDDMLTRLDRHMEDDRDMHRELGHKLDETNRHLSITNATLANLAGKFDGHINGGR